MFVKEYSGKILQYDSGSEKGDLFQTRTVNKECLAGDALSGLGAVVGESPVERFLLCCFVYLLFF